MFCTYCGKELNDDAVVCTGCGCPVTENEVEVLDKKENVNKEEVLYKGDVNPNYMLETINKKQKIFLMLSTLLAGLSFVIALAFGQSFDYWMGYYPRETNIIMGLIFGLASCTLSTIAFVKAIKAKISFESKYVTIMNFVFCISVFLLVFSEFIMMGKLYWGWGYY